MTDKCDDISTIKLREVCRICLYKGELKHMFIKLPDYNMCPAEVLMACTSVEIKENDVYPQNICIKCLEHMFQAYSFIKLCERSNSLLQLYISKSNQDDTQISSDIEFVFDINKNDDNTLISNESIDLSANINKINIESKELTICLKQQNKKEEKDSLNSNNKSTVIKNTYISKSKELRDVSSSLVDIFKCKKCNLQFSSQSELKDHTKKADHSRERKHICNVCNKLYTLSQLKLHMRIHTQEKPYECKTCGLKFNLNGNLKRHIKTHTGERPHRCDICNRGFIQHTSLTDHLRIHTGETPFVCNLCGKSFTQSGQLRKHVKKHIDPQLKVKKPQKMKSQNFQRTYICDICDKAFYSNSILKTHYLTHGDKTFLCSDCGKGFVSKAGLRSHQKVHTGEKPYSCDICGKSFSQIGTLKSHKLIHSGEKPFVCNVCGKAFTQRNHLKYHFRIHSGEKPYKCTVCEKSFSVNGTLTVHMRTHTGETPYVCPICGKGFYDSSSMKKHHRGHVPQTVNS